MTAVAGKEQLRMRIPPPRPHGGAFRQACANFWLNLMFTMSRKAPWFVRGSKGFFVWWAWGCSRHFRTSTIANAKHLLGPDSTMAERKAMGKRVVGSFYDFVSDIGRTSAMTPDELQGQVASVQGQEGYLKLREGGRGAIIATAHMGSFELGMSMMRRVEERIHVVFQRDANSLFERLRSDFRARMGIMEAAVDDGWEVWMRLRDALTANEVVAIQADRAMPGQVGVSVPLLDGTALFPEGPAKLAAITGAPIVPVFTIREPDGRVRIFIEEAIWVGEASEVAITAAIAKLAAVVGRYVQKYPEQWLTVHRAWCEDMDLRGEALAAGELDR